MTSSQRGSAEPATGGSSEDNDTHPEGRVHEEAAEEGESAPPMVPQRPHRPPRPSADELLAAGEAFFQRLSARRSVRAFSDEPVPREAIEWAIRAAGSAPSGAHQQPWSFVVIDDPALKREIREAAEAEEREFYERRASAEWLEAIAPLGTDWQKPFLERAPYLIVVFEVAYGLQDDGSRKKHYYVRESVGLASGMLLAALQMMGLATLTHTPSPMNFLAEVLGRPQNERPFLLIPVGYPAADATVPDFQRKALEQILTYNRDEG